MPHTLLLHPGDVLFFSDGRPMSGSLTGHTAAWPAPHIVNNALHAALHRSGIDGHAHRLGCSGKILSENREKDGRKFGSLLTTGPFPVAPNGAWYFPTPADLVTLGKDTPATIGFTPVPVRANTSSLPTPLTHALAATLPPSKDNKPGNWLHADTWDAYLKTRKPEKPTIPAATFHRDTDIADIEHQTGIGIDAETQTQDGEHFYTAHYLRLRPGWRLGLHAEALDKDDNNLSQKHDLIDALFPSEQHIIIGGQQRLCTVERESYTDKLPRGLCVAEDFPVAADGKCHVKWVLLTPAIFPSITADETQKTKFHPGSWLPNWADAETGKILLKAGDTTRGPKERRNDWRERVRKMPTLTANLVAAFTGKPVTITGWSTGEHAGAKPAQFAVPAGSIYYFTCDTPEAAAQLASTLNWHGEPATYGTHQKIKNRRSTLLGEKGYGLGICGTW